jgi:metalloendopeptidase OMA1, mitochondrial
MKSNTLLPLLLFLVLVSFFQSCSSSSPIKEPTDEEIHLEAKKAYEEVKAKSKISTNKEWTAMVQRVSKRIQTASNVPFQWEVILIESDEVNAWCMPGGKMAVYTGIMKILKTEAALAAVMGHEVAHATLFHGKQRYARAIKGNLAGLVIGGALVVGGQLLCKTETCKLLTGLGGAAAGFAVTFFDRKFSREDETSADKLGQLYMAKAGYDPREAPRVWDRMSDGKTSPPELLSTHPSHERRKDDLNMWMDEALKEYHLAPKKFGLGENIKNL